MADTKPGETTAPAPAPAPAPATAPAPAPAPAPTAQDPHAQAIKTAVADLEKLAADAAGRGDQATVERLRAIALPLANASRAKA